MCWAHNCAGDQCQSPSAGRSLKNTYIILVLIYWELLGRPTVPVLEKIGVAGPPLIGSTYPSAYRQAPSTMASLYGRGAQCWWVMPTNCPPQWYMSSIPIPAYHTPLIPIPCHIPYHTIPFHTIPFDLIPYLGSCYQVWKVFLQAAILVRWAPSFMDRFFRLLLSF